MLVLDAFRVGDGGQVDLLVIFHKDLCKGIQLIQLSAGEGNVPCGTFCFKALFIDHREISFLLFSGQVHKNRLVMHGRQKLFQHIRRPQFQ